MGFYSGWWPGLVGKIPSYVSSTSFGADEKSVEFSVSS
jgi:hypothetical protein